jgi:hypothetical protein
MYTALGDKEEAFRILEKNYSEHNVGIIFLKVAPEFDPLRSDPRFQGLLRRIGLPPEDRVRPSSRMVANTFSLPKRIQRIPSS